jgi:hypothetical protein
MSNHIHLVLRSRPDAVQTWADTEVARRWWTLCPKRKVQREVDGQKLWFPAEPNEDDLNSIRNDTVKLADIRRRLSDISWWMRLLCQYIAMRANSEEVEGLGRFWYSRFKAVRILGEEKSDGMRSLRRPESESRCISRDARNQRLHIRSAANRIPGFRCERGYKYREGFGRFPW